MSEADLQALLADYLRICGFEITGVHSAGCSTVLTYTTRTIDGRTASGVGLAVPQCSPDLWAEVKRRFPAAHTYHILARDHLPVIEAPAVLITSSDIARIALVGILYYSLCQDYFYEVTANGRAFLSFVHQYLADHFDLPETLCRQIKAGWERWLPEAGPKRERFWVS